MPTRAQQFDRIIGASSTAMAKNELSKISAMARRWKKYLAKNPGDKAAERVLKQLEAKRVEVKRSPEGISTLKKVEELPFIKNVLIRERRAVLETEDIVVDWDGTIVNIGSYFLKFGQYSLPDIRRVQGSVKTIFGNYHHPHISRSGDVCWPHDERVEEMLKEARMDGRPDIIATIAWEMLRNAHKGQPYVSCDRFVSAIAGRELDSVFVMDMRRLRTWIRRSTPLRLLRRLARAVIPTA